MYTISNTQIVYLYPHTCRDWGDAIARPQPTGCVSPFMTLEVNYHPHPELVEGSWVAKYGALVLRQVQDEGKFIYPRSSFLPHNHFIV